MTFQLDTTGSVIGRAYVYPTGEHPFIHKWTDLSPFAQGYVEALFASVGGFEAIRADDLRWPGKTSFLGFRHLAPETLARIIADCASFEPEPTVAVTYEYGRQFWRVRQLDRLPKFPALTIILGDDGKVRFAA